MSKRIALLCAFAAAAFTAACGTPQEEEVVFIDQPVVAEPVYSKY
jgi:hypothetical protein